MFLMNKTSYVHKIGVSCLESFKDPTYPYNNYNNYSNNYNNVPARKNFPRLKVIVRGLDECWQADFIDMKAHSGVNRGFKYILTVIDNLSKFGFSQPLKSSKRLLLLKLPSQKYLRREEYLKNYEQILELNFIIQRLMLYLIKVVLNYTRLTVLSKQAW